MLDRHIAGIEEEINFAEKKCLQKTENTQNFISTLHTAVEKAIVDAIAKMKEDQPRNSHDKRQCSCENSRDPTPCKVQLLSDDDYVERLIKENHHDHHEDDERRQPKKKKLV
uniref:Ovule protein n=1 Tax=Haemonchus contortus TaxID=6289 RepID=A0A7I4YMU5_HAECO